MKDISHKEKFTTNEEREDEDVIFKLLWCLPPTNWLTAEHSSFLIIHELFLRLNIFWKCLRQPSLWITPKLFIKINYQDNTNIMTLFEV